MKMKIIKLIILCASISVIYSIPDSLLNMGKTPKATDLTDHFGTEPVRNLYGPINLGVRRLAREGITGPESPITPIVNFSQEINPAQVVAGDLDNTAYDASRIIRAPLAAPKFDIKEKIIHEAVVTTPVHQGTQFEQFQTQSMNRVTGQITKKLVQVEKPIIGMVKNVREVESEHETLIDINNGRVIDVTKRPVFLGANPLDTQLVIN